MNLLLLCEKITPSGGILRFEKIAKTLNPIGHKLYILPLSGEHKYNNYISEAIIISENDACTMTWDITMVPGAGFSDAIIKKFSNYKKNIFGLRVQHILNDKTKKDSFIKVNQSFSPDIIIFNNNWEIGSFTEFKAKQFHFIIGAVDTKQFYPLPYKKIKNINDQITIGGQIGKNPWPLFEMLKYLPNNFTLKLFGNKEKFLSLEKSTQYTYLIEEKRLVLTGNIFDNNLLSYYHNIDIVVSTENFAGWSNMGAEALACGIPLICTPHGIEAFAYNNKTAIILENLKPEYIASKIYSLFENNKTIENLAINGRKTIISFDWTEYSYKLLNICKNKITEDYIYLPEHRLYGKWDVSMRLKGLSDLIKNSKNKTVLDLGMTEGLIANHLLKAGAKHVLGFELQENRVKKSNEINQQFSNKLFQVENLDNWNNIEGTYKNYFEKGFDIILCLGIYHHLKHHTRNHLLDKLLKLSNEWFVIRTPEIEYINNNLKEIIEKDFYLFSSHSEEESNIGNLRIYRKRNTNE